MKLILKAATLLSIFFALVYTLYAYLLLGGTSNVNLFLLAVVLLAAVFITILIPLVCAAAIYYLFRQILLLIFKSEDFKKISTLQFFVAASITILFFPKQSADLSMVFFQIFHEVFLDIPRSVFNLMMKSLECIRGDEGNGLNCGFVIVDETQYEIRKLSRSIISRSGFDELNLPDLFIGISVFAFLASAARYLAARTRNGISVFAFLASAARHLVAKTRNFNILMISYSVLICVAIYLSLTAILTVNLLQSRVDPSPAADSVSGNKLKKELEEYADTTFKATFKTTFDHNPTGEDLNSSDSLSFDDFRYQELHWVLQEIRITENQAKVERDTLKNEFQPYTRRLIKLAVDKYNIQNQVGVGDRESVEHYFLLGEWVRGKVDARESHFKICRDALQSARLGIQYANRLDLSQPNVAALDVYEWESDNLLGDCRSQSSSSISALPSRPALGSLLGPVGWAVSWLAPAENLSVTSIVGLVGFGLLGSLISRLVLKRGDPLEKANYGELASTVFGGFAAALVVYLGAYGEIPFVKWKFIVDIDKQNPLSLFALFIVCFMGAVFSINVWDRIKSLFSLFYTKRY